MLPLTKINLLPYREEIQQQKKQAFKILILCSLLIGLCLCTMTYLGLNREINNQENRNQFLKQEIEKLDQELDEIQKLQQEKETLLKKKQKLEKLQANRFKAAYIIDSLNAIIPEKTYLTEIKAENPTTYILNGKSISNDKIAVFMRALPSTGIFIQPELISINNVDNIQTFTLKVSLNNPSSHPAEKIINHTASEPSFIDNTRETEAE